MRGHRDLVAGADAEGGQDQVDRGGAGRRAEAVLGADEGGEGPLVLDHLATIDKARIVDDILDAFVDRLLVPGVRGLQVDKRDPVVHDVTFSSAVSSG
jgi:hypothetical protein